MALTPDSIRQALTESDGSRKEAAYLLGVSADMVRIYIRKYRDKGEDFPDAENEVSRAAKFYGLIQPGQWAEYGKTQERCEVVEIRHGKALVRYESGVEEWVVKRQLAWVPSGDAIAETARLIRDAWPAGEHAKRARWAIRGAYEIPQVSLEDDSRDVVW